MNRIHQHVVLADLAMQNLSTVSRLYQEARNAHLDDDAQERLSVLVVVVEALSAAAELTRQALVALDAAQADAISEEVGWSDADRQQADEEDDDPDVPEFLRGERMDGAGPPPPPPVRTLFAGEVEPRERAGL